MEKQNPGYGWYEDQIGQDTFIKCEKTNQDFVSALRMHREAEQHAVPQDMKPAEDSNPELVNCPFDQASETQIQETQSYCPQDIKPA